MLAIMSTKRVMMVAIAMIIMTVVSFNLMGSLLPSFPSQLSWQYLLGPAIRKNDSAGTSIILPDTSYSSLLKTQEDSGRPTLNLQPNTSIAIIPDGPQTTLEPGDSHLPYEDPIVVAPGMPTDVIIEPDHQANISFPPLKNILLWNDFFNNRGYAFGLGRMPFLQAGCRVNTCFTTANRTRFPPHQIHALLWHSRSRDKSLPKERWPHTRYVYFLRESPSHVYTKLTAFQDLFNWTFTFRLDSDFPFPYGKVYRRRHPLPDTSRNYAQGKTKLAAWFVSNCRTIGGRETLVQTLRQWIAVDQYGMCGKLKCDKRKKDMCYDMLNKDYKFYLSFENSLCKDYITEKFFNVLRQDVVPVVYGLANYSLVVPPHSYIDALSFPSAKTLADHLLYLHHNDTAYNEYFRWKRFHIMPNDWRLRARSFCKLCELLHTNTSTKTYNIKKWFVDDAHCKSKHSPKINAFIHGR